MRMFKNMLENENPNGRQRDYDYIEKHPSKKAIEIGRRVPYHLQFIRDHPEYNKALNDKNTTLTEQQSVI